MTNFKKLLQDWLPVVAVAIFTGVILYTAVVTTRVEVGVTLVPLLAFIAGVLYLERSRPTRNRGGS